MINVTKSDLPELKEYIKYLKKIWSTRWLTNNGEFVQLLEKKLEEYLKVENLILLSDGTLAIHLALKAFNLKGEVITTPFTFAASTNAILWERLNPIFADIVPDTYNINPDDVEKKITDKTSAILAVHVFGNPCNVEKLQKIADNYKLKLIYDAAHAFGVEYKKQSVLNYGDISVLSFHATKVFNTIEGGAAVVKDEKIFKKIRLLRNHGIKSEEVVILPGINARMNEFQAAMGLCNLKNIDEKIQRRKSIYDYYKRNLTHTRIKFQKIVASKYNFSYMPILLRSQLERDSVFLELIKNDIKPRKYFYPLTVNYNYFKDRDENLVEKYHLTQAIEISNRILCLPLYPDLERDKIEKITDIIRKVLI